MGELEGGEVGGGCCGGEGGLVGGEGGAGGFVGGAFEGFFEVEALTVELGGEEGGVFQADVGEFFAGDVVVEIIVVVLIVIIVGVAAGAVVAAVAVIIRDMMEILRRHLEEFPVGFVLDDTMYVYIRGVIPDTLGIEFHCKSMPAAFVVGECVSGIVATATHGSADETDPKVGVGVTHGTFIEATTLAIVIGGAAVRALM